MATNVLCVELVAYDNSVSFVIRSDHHIAASHELSVFLDVYEHV